MIQTLNSNSNHETESLKQNSAVKGSLIGQEIKICLSQEMAEEQGVVMTWIEGMRDHDRENGNLARMGPGRL